MRLAGFMKGNGRMIRERGMAMSYLLMEIHTMGDIRQERQVERGFISGVMGRSMMGSG